jgi:RNA polymerase sigma factor (sigma-70 family)
MSFVSDIGSTNPELLKLLADMSRSDAWAEFVQRYGPMVHRICCQWGLDYHEREDIRSHVLLKLVETFLSRESRIHASFRGYLYRIITNEILLHLRKKKKDKRIILLQHEQMEILSEVTVLMSEEIESIETDIFDRLSSLQVIFDYVKSRTSAVTWQIFWAITVKGSSTTDAASQFGKNRIAAWKANDRVLQMIRAEVARRQNA